MNKFRTLTNIRIHEIESKNGDYLRLLNISNTDDYDLSNHFLQQNIHAKPFCRFRFPFNTIIGPGQTLTVKRDFFHQYFYLFSVYSKDLVWTGERYYSTTTICFSLERTN